PPPEPSADFDPMPIGGEEHGWVSPATDRWGTGGEEQSAQAETPWKAPAQEPGDWYVSPADETANAEAHPEPAEDEVEHHEGPSFQNVVPQLTPAFMSEELANVVKAAEESATRIIERAWESTQMQIAQVDRLW